MRLPLRAVAIVITAAQVQCALMDVVHRPLPDHRDHRDLHRDRCRCAEPAMRSRREVLKGSTPITDWLSVVRTDFKNSGFVDLAVPLVGLGVALSQRKDTAKILLDLESGPVSGKVQKPEIIISTAKVLGKVNVQIVGPRTLGGELVDYLWLRDAATKDLLGCKALSTNGGAPGSKGDPTLSSLVKRDTRVIPYMHCSVSGLWVGDPVEARTV